MSFGQKIRGFVNTIGNKSKKVASLGHKAGKFIGTFDASLGKDIEGLAHDADVVGAISGDVGDIGSKTGLFREGGVVGTARGVAGSSLTAGMLMPMSGPISRSGMTHLATAGLGATAKLLSQPHEHLRARDIVTRGSKLARGARSHLKAFRR